jgi:hypothetical protein
VDVLLPGSSMQTRRRPALPVPLLGSLAVVAGHLFLSWALQKVCGIGASLFLDAVYIFRTIDLNAAHIALPIYKSYCHDLFVSLSMTAAVLAVTENTLISSHLAGILALSLLSCHGIPFFFSRSDRR